MTNGSTITKPCPRCQATVTLHFLPAGTMVNPSTAEAFAVYLHPLPEVRKEGPFLDGFPAGGGIRIGIV